MPGRSLASALVGRLTEALTVALDEAPAVSGGEAPPDPTGVLIFDTFTGSNGTDVAARSPDNGGPWVQLSGGAASCVITGNRAAASGSPVLAANVGRSDGIVLTANLTFGGTSGNISLFLAGDSNISHRTVLCLFYRDDESIFCEVYVDDPLFSGASQFVGNISDLGFDTSFNVRIERNGSTISVSTNRGPGGSVDISGVGEPPANGRYAGFAIAGSNKSIDNFKVESTPAPLQLSAAEFVGDDAYARLAATIGSVGATDFEVQAYVSILGARGPEERVFMVQFPAGRQSGLFAAHDSPFDLVTGDSQVGSVGGEIGSSPSGSRWTFLTYAADSDPAPTGLWDGSLESLDGTQPYTSGGRAKGVEDSLTGERLDLNGGGANEPGGPDGHGFAEGIRIAELRFYNGPPRSELQRRADAMNVADFSEAEAWFRFSDDGDGNVIATDMTGNGYVIEMVGATLANGPSIPFPPPE